MSRPRRGKVGRRAGGLNSGDYLHLGEERVGDGS